MRHHPVTPQRIAAIGILAFIAQSCDSPTQRALTDDFRERVDAVLFEAESRRSDSDFRHSEYTSRSGNAEATRRNEAATHLDEGAAPAVDATTLLRQYVLRNIADNYFEAVHVDTTLPVDTIIARLDPFSHHFTKREYNEFTRGFQDQALRYGVQLQSAEGRVILTSVVQGSVAELAGILPGDELQRINGRPLNGSDSLASALLLSQSYANLLLFRSSTNASFERGLSRANCPESSVPLVAMIDTQTGYVQVTGFHFGTTQKLRDAIVELLHRGMKSLVLDLRDNPGGLLKEAIDMANLFAHDGGQTVLTNSRVVSQISQYSLSKEADFPSLPLAILVDNGSCSAAEVFTGIMQDLDRAVIVGQPTIGKSLVMNFFKLPREEWLYLTVAYYMLPSGRSVQRPYTNGVLNGGEYRNFGSCDNHRHTMDSVLAEGDCPAYKTASGRTVHGFIGIVPEYVVAQEHFYSDWFRDAVCGAAASYLRQNAGWLLHTTMDSFSRFCEMPQALVDTLLGKVREHDTTKTKLTSLQAACMTPKIVKAYVAWSIWGDDGFFKLWEQNSATVRRAVELLRSKPAVIAVLGQ